MFDSLSVLLKGITMVLTPLFVLNARILLHQRKSNTDFWVVVQPPTWCLPWFLSHPPLRCILLGCQEFNFSPTNELMGFPLNDSKSNFQQGSRKQAEESLPAAPQTLGYPPKLSPQTPPKPPPKTPLNPPNPRTPPNPQTPPPRLLGFSRGGRPRAPLEVCPPVSGPRSFGQGKAGGGRLRRHGAALRRRGDREGRVASVWFGGAQGCPCFLRGTWIFFFFWGGSLSLVISDS